jgi:TatD DNase family protein
VRGLTDSHAHVWWKTYDGDRAEVLERARQAGVERMVLVGTDVETSRAAFQLAGDVDWLHPTAGIHPHDAADADEPARATVRELCAREDCVGVGETGLDFFKEYSPRAAQEQSFRWHLELARALDKPVVIHGRDAHERMVAVLREHAGVRGVMHCYTMGPDELHPYLELGLFISFSGVVTYPKNEPNRAAAAEVPLDHLLVETDCPFLSPQSRRGKRNEPAYVREVLATVASVRPEPLEELALETGRNAARLFGLPTP